MTLSRHSELGVRPSMDRIEVGTYYTDGAAMYEVTYLHDLGMVGLQDIATEAKRDVGIEAFRRNYWRAK